ncbi:LysR family transcriptional regulator [Telmatobacter bradus]|uniref:LysR family transcriptional regulator n=1 Tax=Telmatobacter bradus TaxID=474953 RepID=UPI003B438D05
MIEIRHLRCFAAVAEELHFTRAAQLLHLAQPALSQSIRQLEEEVGTPLIVRSTRRVELTPAGHNFYDRARQTLQTLEQAVSSTIRIARNKQQSLIVGFTSSGLYGVLPELLSKFRATSPETQLIFREFTPDALVAAMRAESLDVAILHGTIHDPSLECQLIERESCVLALPAQHRLARKRRGVSLDELEDETLLIPQKTSFFGLYEAFSMACARHGIVHRINTMAPSMQTLIGLVATGAGVAIVPPSIALPRKDVVYLPLRGESIEIERNLIWSLQNQAPAIAQLRRLAKKIT